MDQTKKPIAGQFLFYLSVETLAKIIAFILFI